MTLTTRLDTYLPPLDTDSISVVLAFIALTISGYVVLETRKLARHTTYTRLHELLIDPKAAYGRRLLFMAAAKNTFPSVGDPDWDKINYSLALYDTLGAYLQQGLVDRDLVLRAWHDPLIRIKGPAEQFVAIRQGKDPKRPWEFLFYLLAEAEAYAVARGAQPPGPVQEPDDTGEEGPA